MRDPASAARYAIRQFWQDLELEVIAHARVFAQHLVASTAERMHTHGTRIAFEMPDREVDRWRGHSGRRRLRHDWWAGPWRAGLLLAAASREIEQYLLRDRDFVALRPDSVTRAHAYLPGIRRIRGRLHAEATNHTPSRAGSGCAAGQDASGTPAPRSDRRRSGAVAGRSARAPGQIVRVYKIVADIFRYLDVFSRREK